MAAIERWVEAMKAYDFARAEMEEARRQLVAALHGLGVKGFSL